MIEPAPNFSLQLTVGRSLARRPSRLPCPPRHGVTPLADAARRHFVSCGKRRAALPLAHGASPQLSERSVSRAEGAEGLRPCIGTAPHRWYLRTLGASRNFGAIRAEITRSPVDRARARLPQTWTAFHARSRLCSRVSRLANTTVHPT